MYNNELTHWGIKGMKWGRRRYQNKDGSLTPEGKKRYDDSEGTEGVEQKKERILKSRSPKELFKNADLFSDAELQKAYNRLSLERNIANLSAGEVSKGAKFVDNVIKSGNKTSDFLVMGTKLYNNVARVLNSFDLTGEKPLPLISGDKGKKDKDKKD